LRVSLKSEIMGRRALSSLWGLGSRRGRELMWGGCGKDVEDTRKPLPVRWNLANRRSTG